MDATARNHETGAPRLGARRVLLFVAGGAAAVGALVLSYGLLDFQSGPPGPVVGEVVSWLVFLSPVLIAIALLIGHIRSDQHVPWLAFTLGAATPWALLFPIAIAPSIGEYMGRIDFEAAAWKHAAWDGESNPPETRIKMVDDLMASGALESLTRDEVLALLGPDDGAEGTTFGGGYFGGWDLRYWLGMERGFISIDSEWLVIRFDDGGQVAAYRLVTD